VIDGAGTGMNNLKRTVVWLLFLSTFVEFSFPMDIVEGQPFPQVKLPLLKTGEPSSLFDFRGRRVVLHIFASW
jgi:hypothetical protein